ncbi:DUF637 domain-containing protein [Xenorhabdus bovienii]|uniref:DUF637 domain-containing protein n=1 Tax=Xenorhabdus bovienii TaxID=40576 RepID=UPI00237D17A7|nr:DUF637 domain-containing protein [Xenorhabdus bovienii]MDE1475125.1 DUF637 domain-containing protein [Xenorhabdus bovienii]
MDKYNNPMARGTCYLLIYLTGVYPLNSAFAGGITPDNSQTQVQNNGNVPVVNIAAPNNAGISHNTYKEFNTDTQGAVLNNATQAVNSQLAGQINANANLQGEAAQLIINEVTGSSRSELLGQLEVAGHKANVMIANPNGITCDGCGFINTSGAVLTTGKPQFDTQGALEALNVTKGQITIGGKGLNGQSTDYVDIISRATELNGKIQANNLALTQGANQISFKDGTTKTIAGEGAAPQLAVDTKALGGMYANKIRLVATEDGVGVNLKDITSNQRDITLSTSGKMELGNIKAKTDLNVGAKEINIEPNSPVQAERNIILASSKLSNKGSVTAGQDMRIYGDTISNVGIKALLQANNNMWLQKNVQGDKSNLIENRSATIKTNKGDLIARSERMLNIRDIYLLSNIKPEKGAYFDFSNVDDLSDMTNWFFIENYDSSLISSGGNLYIKSDDLLNINSEINGIGDVFLTGGRFASIKLINTKDQYFENRNLYPHFIIDNLHTIFNNPYYRYRNKQENSREIHVLDRNNSDIKQQDWNIIQNNPSNETKVDPFTDKTMLSSGKNLVIDFLGEVKITSNKSLVNENDLNDHDPSWKERILNLLNSEADDIKAQNNIMLNANGFTLKSARLNAEKDINIFSSDADFVDLSDSKIISKSGDLSILSTYYKAPYKIWDDILQFPSAISIYSTVLKGNNISLISKNSGISTGKSYKMSLATETADRSTIINSSGDLTLSSGTNLDLDFVNYPTKNKSTTLTAAREVKLKGNNKASIDSSESISINGGVNLDISGVKLIAGKEVILNSSQDSKLWSVPIAANSISISTGRNLNITNSSFNATENVLMNSGGDLNLSAAYGNPGITIKEGQVSYITSVDAGNKLTLIANDDIKLEGSNLISKNDMTITSGGYTYLKSAVDTENTESRSSITHKGAILNSGNNLTIFTGEGLLFQATKLLAKGVMDIAAKGGYLYAQAQEDVTEYTTSSSKRNWYGKKKTSTTTHHSVTNKVTEFIADGDINLLSRDDSTYEASKIETNNNATLTSTHGKINFKAVKDSSFEQTISQSKGFFIKNRDNGHRAETWVLPSVHIGGTLTIDAANGISADIKTQKGQSLQAVLAALGDTPEAAWLKELSQRKDVNWNEVQDAYENWDHESQHLNPVVSAVIAIAVAVVTAGAGVTIAAANAAAGTASGAAAAAGAGAATTAAVSTATYGAVSAGISSLASTAAVSLINNQGNISKTLKEMGSSQTVKSTVTSMAIGGALSGFDQAMGWTAAKDGANAAASSTNSNVPLLSKGDWIKTAQRVAGQSVISSSLNTAINGGSFKDNFATALLSNVGNQINAEGANLIGNNGAVLGVPGKAISHAAVSALAAEIGGGDAKGAAAGALAAELAAIVMESTLFESTYKNEPERQIHKLQEALTGNETKTQTAKMIGALSGALISGTPEGVYSAANSAELVYRYNYTEHMLDQIARENGRDMAAAAKGDQAAAERVAARQDAAIAVTAIAAGGYALTAGRYILIAASAEARLALQACKADPILCVNQAGIFAADVVGPEAAMGTLAAGGTVKVLSNSTENAKNLAKELSHASTALLKNEKPNTHAVTSLVEKEALYTGKRAQENYRVYDLNEVTDRALDLNLVRQETKNYLKASHQKGDKAVSYATASVEVNGITEYYLSVSGKAWSGSSPTTVNINGVNYKVILTDSESIPSIGIIKTKQTNLNHAEQKLFNHIQDTYNGQKANVNVAVQNTSTIEPGMCVGCEYTSQNFAEMNKNFNVNIFQGSTGGNP